MIFKIAATTDGKYEGDVLILAKLPEVGETIHYKDSSMEIEQVIHTGNRIKFISSNYIAELELIGG